MENRENRGAGEQYDKCMSDIEERSPRRPSGDASATGNGTVLTIGDGNDGCTLYISNLATSVCKKTLREMFQIDGDVEECQIVYNPITRESRGFGFVRMATSEQSRRAIERHNNETVHGRKMTVALAKRKHAHEPTPGYYKGPISTQLRYDQGRGEGGNWHRSRGSSGDRGYGSRRRDYGDSRGLKSDRDRSDRYDDRYSWNDNRYEDRRYEGRDARYRYSSPIPERREPYGRRYSREQRHSRDIPTSDHRSSRMDRDAYDRRASPEHYSSRVCDTRRSPPNSREPVKNERRRHEQSWRRTPSPKGRR